MAGTYVMPPSSWKRLIPILFGTGFVVLFGTLGYVLLERWPFVDALYMTIITLTTVGYGEIHTLDQPGRVFTVVLILMGVGLLAYSAAAVGAFFLDGTLASYLRRRRMGRLISGMNGHCIVCGYGRTGQEVVSTLKAREVPFVVIEADPQMIEQLERERIAAIHGLAHENEVLEMARIATAKALVACASNDAENVFITLSARALRPDLIIAVRAEDRGSESKLRRAGANHVVSPYVIAGDRLVASVYRPALVQFLESHVRKEDGYDVREIVVGSAAKERSLSDLRVRAEYQTTVMALRREDGTLIPNPAPTMQLAERDILLALGPKEQMDRLAKDIEGRS